MKDIAFILIGVMLNASAQLSMRFGMLRIGSITSAAALVKSLPKMACSIWLWLSLVFYAASVVVWMVVLSRVEVSFAYAFISIGFVIVAGMGYLLFNEQMTLLRIVGIALIGTGVILVSQT